MSKNKSIMQRLFGRHEGIELIAKRLREGSSSVLYTSGSSGRLYWFVGTGKYKAGHGNRRTYDISYFHAEVPLYGNVSAIKGPTPLSMHNHVFDREHYCGDADMTMFKRPSDRSADEVIDLLKSIAAKLKPHQKYTLTNGFITQDLFVDGKIQFFTRDGSPYHIGHDFIAQGHFITERDFERGFAKDYVAVHDEEKISRKHRSDTDIKRWYELKKVTSVDEPHTFKFTHQQTANAPVHYYKLDVIIDSKAMAKHPFYIKQIVQSAANQLGRLYDAHQYNLVLNTDTIDITWNDQKVSLEKYLDEQNKYPALADSKPIVFFKPLCVYYSYSDDSHGITEK